jgi:hypothetical protein
MTGTLLSIAELAVAISGFAAIVEVVSAREKGRWDRDDFNGMVFHALVALVFSLTPVVLIELGLASDRAWRILGGVLGLFMLAHSGLVAWVYVRPRERSLELLAVLLPCLVGGALVGVGLGWRAWPASGVFLAGLSVQLVQAAALFFRLVYQRGDARP